MANIQKFSQPVRVGNFGSAPSDVSAGAIYYNTGSGKLQFANGTSYADIAIASNEFLSNVFRIDDSSDPTKKLAFSVSGISSATTRTITMPDANVDLGNLTNSNISASAAISYSKLAALTANRLLVSDGSGFVSVSSVTTTEAGYLSGVTSSIQDQLDAKQDLSEKGQANGYASLDGAGKVPVSQLPNSVMEYQGAWDADTNTPTIADGVGNAGDVYRVSVAGTQDLGSGPIEFFVGDFVIYSGSIWERSPMADGVQSVNGQSGIVVLDTDDISEGTTNLYFTDERAEDAVGGILANSSKVSLTYNDGAPSITADIVAGSLVNADISASAAIAYSKLNLTGSIVNADINASAAIAYSKLNLSGSIVNADINASAAIAYSKLALSNSIVNADINASAAIAYSKLNLSASIVNADVASGANIDAAKLGTGSVSNTEFGYLDGVTSAIQTQLDGKVAGPASATDNAVARYDGTTGKLVQDSLVSVSDTGGMTLQDTFLRGDNSSSNVVEEEYVHNATLTSSTTAVLSNFTFDSRTYKSVQIDYMVKNGNDRRTGMLMVVCNNASGADATVTSLTDQSTETADLSLSWSAAINSHNIEISYTTSSGTYRINADIKRFMAN